MAQELFQELSLEKLAQKLLQETDKHIFYQNYVVFQKKYDDPEEEMDSNKLYETVNSIDKKLQGYQLEAIKQATQVLKAYDKDKSTFQSVIDELNALNKIPCCNPFAQRSFLNTGDSLEIYKEFLKYQGRFLDAMQKKEKNSGNDDEIKAIKNLAKAITKSEINPFEDKNREKEKTKKIEIEPFYLARWIFLKSDNGKSLEKMRKFSDKTKPNKNKKNKLLSRSEGDFKVSEKNKIEKPSEEITTTTTTVVLKALDKKPEKLVKRKSSKSNIKNKKVLSQSAGNLDANSEKSVNKISFWEKLNTNNSSITTNTLTTVSSTEKHTGDQNQSLTKTL